MNPAESSPASLDGWQQGDCCLGKHWFLVRFAPDKPLTEDSKSSAEQGSEISEAAYPGFVILSQTCDIVRAMGDRPYIEIAALRLVEPDELEQIKKERKPRFAFIPGLEGRLLVADLDLVNTVEKAVLVGFAPVRGCRTDDEIRRFAEILARKRVRFAFPDSFTEMLGKWQSRLRGKHEKFSEEGQAARWIRQFRLAASPNWNADQIQLHFWIILDDAAPEGSASLIEKQFEKWVATFSRPVELTKITWQVASLDTMTAREYLQSDPLDLDHLSGGSVSSK